MIMNKQVLFGIFAGISFVFLGYFLLSQSNTVSSGSPISPKEYPSANNQLLYDANIEDSVAKATEPHFFGNITDTIAQGVSGEFLSGIDITTQEDVDTILKRIENKNIDTNLISQNLSPESVGFIDVHTIPESYIIESLSSLPSDEKRYLDSVFSILSEINFEDNTRILENALSELTDTGDDSDVSNIIRTYNKAISDMQSLPVPHTYIDFHKSMIVPLWNFSLFLDAMVDIDTDPFRAMVAAEYYQTIQEQWSDFVLQLNVIE